jgi:peptidoglycan/xylan/chitin deacetylase (PgdA/CDA1 family)
MIRGKKQAIAQFLMSTGLHRPLSRLAPASLTVVNFHRIREGRAGKSGDFTEFDAEVFGPTADEFRAQMNWLKANSDLLSESDLLSGLRSGQAFSPRASMVTFDDGYLDNFTLALPILKELRVPAIFFIPTLALEDRSLGWWDVISYLLKKTQKTEIVLKGERLALSPDRGVVRTTLLQRMKLTSAEENQSLVQDLAQACAVELPSRELCGGELMTWDQVRETSQSGVSIGSHTHTHRVLATLDLATQREELSISKSQLERQLGKPVRTLAYPVGGYEHFNRETFGVAKECGYEAAFSFHTGVNQLGSLNPYDIKRVSAPETPALYCGLFALPQVFATRKCEAAAPVPARPHA